MIIGTSKTQAEDGRVIKSADNHSSRENALAAMDWLSYEPKDSTSARRLISPPVGELEQLQGMLRTERRSLAAILHFFFLFFFFFNYYCVFYFIYLFIFFL